MQTKDEMLAERILGIQDQMMTLLRHITGIMESQSILLNMQGVKILDLERRIEELEKKND